MAPLSTPHVPLPTVPHTGPSAAMPGYAPGPGAASAVRLVGGAGSGAATRTATRTARGGTAGGPHAPTTLDALLDSMRSERKLLEDLAATMRRQRTAVGVDDLQTVDDTVFATHRILATLGQARLRRRQISRILAGVDEIPLRELEDVIGPQMSDPLRGARDELQASAQALSREVDVNRRVLRDALAHGESHARVLVGAEDAGAAGAMRYAPDGHTHAASPGAGGLLVNRTA